MKLRLTIPEFAPTEAGIYKIGVILPTPPHDS